MKWIISDVHGCMNTLMALLEKLPKEVTPKDIIFVGDLIDRGPDSRKVINFVRDGGYDVVLGNHEELMIEAVNNYINHNVEVEDNRIWMQNGGRACLANYQESYGTDYDSLIEDTEWLRNLPNIGIYTSELDDKGRILVVTHAVSIDFIDTYVSLLSELENKNIEDLSIEEKHKTINMNELIVWNRNIPKSGSKIFFNISGHNIIDHFIFNNRNELRVKKENITLEHILVDKELGYACIDTGAFSKNTPYGNKNCSGTDKIDGNPYRGRMTCISFSGLEVIQQCNIEEFDWR